MHGLTLLIISFALGASIRAEEITAKVYNPSDVYPESYSKEYAGKPVIYDFIKPLILTMQEAQSSDFISSSDATPSLQWRLQHLIIVSGDIVSVRFSEGHADVIGIFVRNNEKKQWELKTEIGGTFKFRVFSETTGNPKLGEQGGADQPATAPESKSKGKEKPKPESEGRPQ